MSSGISKPGDSSHNNSKRTMKSQDFSSESISDKDVGSGSGHESKPGPQRLPPAPISGTRRTSPGPSSMNNPIKQTSPGPSSMTNPIKQTSPGPSFSHNSTKLDQPFPQGSVLIDSDIKKYLDEDQIIINSGLPDQPFDTSSISNCSVDVTLGPYYFLNTSRSLFDPKFIDPTSQDSIINYWGPVRKALPPSSSFKVTEKIRNHPCIVIPPRETILAHTQEFIGSNSPHITTMLKCRSSLARMGVDTHKGAGWGDIGYFSRWTLEITNFTNRSVILPQGMRVGQIIFFYTSGPGQIYSGKYQKGDRLEAMIQDWSPDSLLPRCYLDKEFKTPSNDQD